MISTEGKTVQQVIDEIMDKLYEQGKRCGSEFSCGNGIDCLYDDGLGNHCAVGWLLPPGNKDIMSNLGTVYELTEDISDLGENDSFIRDNHQVLMILQNIHDSDLEKGQQDYIRDLKLAGFNTESSERMLRKFNGEE